MATVEYYTGQRPEQYKNTLASLLSVGLNTFFAEAIEIATHTAGPASAILGGFIKASGLFPQQVSNYEIRINGQDVTAGNLSFTLNQGLAFIVEKIALDYTEKVLAAVGLRSAAVAVGFATATYPISSAVAVALVTHEVFSHFGITDGITNLVNRIFNTETVHIDLLDKEGNLIRGVRHGGGIAGQSDIDAVKSLIQTTGLGGPATVDSQIAFERAQNPIVSYSLKAANLAAQIAAPLLTTAAQVLGWSGAQDETGQPKINSDIFLPFNEFTIINDKAKIALEIPTGTGIEKIALSPSAIATNGDVRGLRDFTTVAVFGSSGSDSMQVPNPLSAPGTQKVYAFGGGGDDTIRTGAGNDLIFGDNADINSSAANRPQDGSDTIFAGAGEDQIYGGGRADHIFGEDDRDIIYGQAGNDEIDGGEGDDDLFGGPGNDDIVGGGGKDRIWGGVGKDYIDGGDGDDILVAGSDGLETDTADNDLFGGAGNDKLFGDKGNDYLEGEDGRDALEGNDGADQFFGDRDADSYRGGAGADEFFVGPQDRVLDSAADDKLFLQYTQVTSTSYMREFREFGSFPDHGSRFGYNYYAVGDTDDHDRHLFINTGRTLFVFYADGQVAALANYDAGDFGITIPTPEEFLARANQEFSETWGLFQDSHFISEPYSKMLAEALRLEAKLSDPNSVLEISASAKEYVAKILRPDLHGPGYDETTEGVGSITPLRMLNAPNAPDFASNDDASGDGGFAPLSSGPGITLTGTVDGEFLRGTDGDDTLAGAAGNDILYGALGSDTYVYLKDDGFDVIIDFDGIDDVDILQLSNINPDDITIMGDGTDLIIFDRSRSAIENDFESYNTLFVVGQFEGDGSGVEQIHFADGTVWDREAIASHALHAPTDANLSGGSVEENSEGGSFVGQLSGIDPDFDARFTYSLIDDAGGLFVVNATGRLAVADGATIDFEAASSHDVTVRVTDQTGLFVDKTFAIAIENLVGITLTGTEANDALAGTIEEDTLIGLGGNDTLNGGIGADSMAGGLGNDTYTVDNVGDAVVENLGEGTDTVKTALASYALAENVENLSGTGTVSQTLTGNSLNNTLSGGAGDDTLIGGDGNDSLNGGTGADNMSGGLGNDTYTVDNADDTVLENAGEGTDTVKTSLAVFTLGDTFENLTGTGTTSQVLSGNASANTISGGAGDDTLIGGDGGDSLNGGAGADQMVGGSGDDTYTVDASGDAVVENPGEGVDTVKTALVAYTLGDDIENLTGTGSAGQFLSGNDLVNTISGGAGDDTLSGAEGNDTLKGGAGNDALYGGAGNDTLNGGGGNDALYGDAGDDTITGATEDDLIEGGSGNDKLTGAAGNDAFVFHAGFGKDTITDFAAGPAVADVIEFHDGIFADLAALLAASHQVGNSVQIDIDANTNILLKSVTLANLNANDFAFL